MRHAHNTVFGSKRSAISALAVYFLHSTRPNVTWLNSRSSLTACYWLMSALSAVPSTRVWRCRKSVEVSCTECTVQGNDFELTPAVKMETRHPIEGLFGNEFPSVYNYCGVMAAWSRKTLKKLIFFAFFGKTTPCGKVFKVLFRKDSSRHRSTCCVQMSWNLADGKSVKSCVIYPTKITKFRLAL